MKNSPARTKLFRVYMDLWVARIGSIFAWFWMVIWALGCILTLPEAFSGDPDSIDILTPLISLGLAVLNWLMLRRARRIKALVQDFRLYSSVLAGDPEKSVLHISNALNLPEEKVMERLQKMCARGYYRGHIDYSTKQMVFDPMEEAVQVPAGNTAVRCPGCGAPNLISGRAGECRYCGSALTAQEGQP